MSELALRMPLEPHLLSMAVYNIPPHLDASYLTAEILVTIPCSSNTPRSLEQRGKVIETSIQETHRLPSLQSRIGLAHSRSSGQLYGKPTLLRRRVLCHTEYKRSL